MPLILTREYIYAVAVALVVTLIAKRAGLHHRILWLLTTAAIILTLWAQGLHPLGFLVSWGGWVTFLLTVLIGRMIQRIVLATR
jgi:hypothetical protein